MLIGANFTSHGPSLSLTNNLMGQTLKKGTLSRLQRDSTVSLSPEKYLDVEVHVQPLTNKASKPPKKAVMSGSKIYVSSKIVDALMQSKIHTDNLAEKRSTLKD